MADLRRATFTGVTDIMSAFESITDGNNYYYSVWLSQRDIAFQCTQADIEKGKAFLEDNLHAYEQAGNDDLLILKFHPATTKGFIDRKTPVIATVPIRVVPIGEGKVSGFSENFPSANMGTSANFKMFEAIEIIKTLPDKINEKLNSFELRLQAIEDTDPEPEEIDPTQKFIGQITGVLGNPQIMETVRGLIGLLSPQQRVVHQQISGVENQPAAQQPEEPQELNNELLNTALNRLNNYCKLDTDLTLLADLAENNKPMFDMLLNNLRTQNGKG